MVHLWPYESCEQRIAVRDKAFADVQWLNYLILAAGAIGHLQAMQLIPCPIPGIKVEPNWIDDNERVPQNGTSSKPSGQFAA
jgi:NIPSNAP protein